MIIGANCFGGFVHGIMTKCYAFLIAFSFHELVETIDVVFLLKFGN